MANNINDLYVDALYRLRDSPIEQTRNGMVKTLTRPSTWTVQKPTERVLFCPQRMANPYFHLMETVWMFAGANDVAWLSQFNTGIEQYADNGVINGAYGHRWQNHFGHNQIYNAIECLKGDPESRQAVIAMWDARRDGWPNVHNDRPCNTHIYLRVVQGRLDMTVCNRSNDVVWGMCGANIVHMTYLHELIASALKCPIGHYHVVTNNLHIYQRHWDLLESPQVYDHYHNNPIDPLPLLTGKDYWWELLQECEMFIKNGNNQTYENQWLEHTVKPMYEHYMCRLNGDKDTYDINEVEAGDWRTAAYLWREWHE